MLRRLFRVFLRKHITDAANRMNEPSFGARLDLVAQVVDVYVQHIAVVFRLVAPHILEDAVSRESFFRMAQQISEQLGLAIR